MLNINPRSRIIDLLFLSVNTCMHTHIHTNTHMFFHLFILYIYMKVPAGFPGGSEGKASAYDAGDPGLILGLGRSPGEGNSNPLQYSCPENPMDEGAW